jgi:DNA-binding NarL/FixJ family response regulator
VNDIAPIAVVLVDDHQLVRSGLASLVDAAPDMTVVGTASDGREALELLAGVDADVVLMDLSMPVMDGIAATRELLRRAPSTQVLVLTSFADRARVREAIDAGAVGYLLKDAEPADLLEAIRAVGRGESPIDPRVARTLLQLRTTSANAGLTSREQEVLALVGEGKANKQIARALGISERTVKAHLTSIFSRLGVADRTQAALWARSHLGPTDDAR